MFNFLFKQMFGIHPRRLGFDFNSRMTRPSPEAIGRAGEKDTSSALSPFKRKGARILRNLYIPVGPRLVTEIDIVMVSTHGVVVIESKNMAGWIFGKENDRQWTQTLPAGRGKSRKTHFYNPIRQNEGHIRHLAKLINIRVPCYFSMIVFSDGCTFKNLKVSKAQPKVFTRRSLNSKIKKVMDHNGEVLSQEEVERIYKLLLDYENADTETIQRHAETVEFASNR